MFKKIYRKFYYTCKSIAESGLVAAAGGNASIRDGKKIYITSAGSRLSDLKKKDIVTFNIDSDDALPDNISCEWRIHKECYKNRADIKSIVHTHPVYCTVLGFAAKDKLPVSYELVTSMGSELKVLDYLPSGSQELAAQVSGEITKVNAVIMAGHGIVVAGGNLREAADRSIILERQAQKWLLFKILRKLNIIDEKAVQSVKNITEV